MLRKWIGLLLLCCFLFSMVAAAYAEGEMQLFDRLWDEKAVNGEVFRDSSSKVRKAQTPHYDDAAWILETAVQEYNTSHGSGMIIDSPLFCFKDWHHAYVHMIFCCHSIVNRYIALLHGEGEWNEMVIFGLR